MWQLLVETKPVCQSSLRFDVPKCCFVVLMKPLVSVLVYLKQAFFIRNDRNAGVVLHRNYLISCLFGTCLVVTRQNSDKSQQFMEKLIEMQLCV